MLNFKLGEKFLNDNKNIDESRNKWDWNRQNICNPSLQIILHYDTVDGIVDSRKTKVYPNWDNRERQSVAEKVELSNKSAVSRYRILTADSTPASVYAKPATNRENIVFCMFLFLYMFFLFFYLFVFLLFFCQNQ